jgi:hypothetical protein
MIQLKYLRYGRRRARHDEQNHPDRRARPTPVKDALDNGDLSVNAGYNITRLLEKLPEEARDARQSAVFELAKQRKDYKAAFDISLDDMNALSKATKEPRMPSALRWRWRTVRQRRQGRGADAAGAARGCAPRCRR